jgi:DNA helicase II / ATP-dependent DNA helicase PcrA
MEIFYVLNVVDGCMPSDLGAGTSAELEEERACSTLR